MRSRVMPAMLGALPKLPGLRLTFDVDDDQEGLGKLKSGGVELAVIPRDAVVREVDSKLLKPERYVLVVPTAWRKRPVRDVVANETIVDFDARARDQLTLQYLQAHGLHELARPERHFANNTDALAAVVAAGAGYSVLVDEFAKPLVAAGSIAVLQPRMGHEVSHALVWYPRPQMPADLKALIRAVF
jgi:DNA-binding transcriptional LysR family regulator